MNIRMLSVFVAIFLLLQTFAIHGYALATSYVFKYEYDAKHRILYNETPEFVQEFDRDADNGRLVGFLQHRNPDRIPVHRINFEYDQNGCLSLISDENSVVARFGRNEKCSLQRLENNTIELNFPLFGEHDINVVVFGVGSLLYHIDPKEDQAKMETTGDPDQVSNILDTFIKTLDNLSNATGLNWFSGNEDRRFRRESEDEYE